MKKIVKSFAIILSAVIFLTSCASTTLIESTPSGATVYIDNQKKGTTPYSYSDTKISGSATNITLKKEGYQDFNTTLIRNERVDVGAVVGGCFVLIPFLWTMQYDPNRNYELEPGVSSKQNLNNDQSNSNSTNELIKLKNLLDQGAITNEDFTTLKVRILNDEYDYSNSTADRITKLKGLLDSNLLTKDEYNLEKNKLVNGK